MSAALTILEQRIAADVLREIPVAAQARVRTEVCVTGSIRLARRPDRGLMRDGTLPRLDPRSTRPLGARLD